MKNEQTATVTKVETSTEIRYIQLVVFICFVKF